MNKYYQPNSYAKPYTRISSDRTSSKQQPIIKSNSHVKFHLKSKISEKHSYSKQFLNENSSERNLYKREFSSQQRTKQLFQKPKVYKSHSQTKNKHYIANCKDFLIRIPKNQNLIQNYIQQLKQLKKKINSQKNGLQQFHKEKNQKRQIILLKKPEQQKQETKIQKKDEKQKYAHLKKTQVLITDDHRIFSRDMKKHMKKLKLFKQFVNENEHEDNINQEQEIKYNEQTNKSNFMDQQYSSKFEQIWSKKIIYGNVINVKQQFRIDKLPFDTKFNRYSSQKGRKLYSVSKSLNVRRNQKQRIQTQQKIERYNNSRSLVLKRRKTQVTDKKTQLQKLPLKPIQQQQNQTHMKQIVNTQRSPSKKYSHSFQQQSNQKQLYTQGVQHPFKSIQGFSTIQAKKQTIDMLGESCMQIKKNLIRSHKKMDHILDLLGYNMSDLKQNEQKQKKRKMSFQRFSKAFPKGFFQ